MAYLRVYLNDQLLEQIPLNKDQFSIGRDSQCDIVLDNPGVSSIHALIQKQQGVFVITDQNSTNGLFVNEQRVQQHSLNYRDEIQIYNYILKFMATAGLQSVEDPDLAVEQEKDLAKTMAISISDVNDLAKLRDKKKKAFVQLDEGKRGKRKIPVGNVFTIGKSPTTDLRTSGWFAPAVAAEIRKQRDGYYLVPIKRAKTKINSQPVQQSTRLRDGDRFSVRNLEMVFFHKLTSN